MGRSRDFMEKTYKDAFLKTAKITSTPREIEILRERLSGKTR